MGGDEPVAEIVPNNQPNDNRLVERRSLSDVALTSRASSIFLKQPFSWRRSVS